MQLKDFSAFGLNLDSIPGARDALTWTVASVESTTRRVFELATLIDRAGNMLDDIAELRRSAQTIAESLGGLTASAGGIDRNAGAISQEISGLSNAAQGIDVHAAKLANGIDELVEILPTLRRLTEIVDPLDNTVVRLGRFVDRLPGSGRRAPRAVRD